MIVLGQYPANHSTLFRGKDCNWWNKNRFQNLQWVEKDSHFEFLVLFNPDTFIEIDSNGISEIVDSVRNHFKEDPASGKKNVYSPDGFPFVIFPVEAYNALKPDLDNPQLFSQLKNHSQVKTLSQTFKSWDLKTEFREIERYLIGLQLMELQKRGVAVDDFNNFYIEGSIPIEKGSRICSGVVLVGESSIGENVTLYPHAFIENSAIGDDCIILPGCIVRDSSLEKNVKIGPYTHLRGGVLLKEGSKTGNFVEMKKTVLGRGSKSMHLSYIGDATVGDNVNIGAGTITCNYDGVNKHKTVIEDNVFVGSGTQLVAPVSLNKNAYVGAGSTITEDVPEDSLALARTRQRNVLNWVKKKREKDAKKK
ncbi:MAG: hypothetical protein GY757_20450 [bacterium]|nr:hypothetical protein [bacterium]